MGKETILVIGAYGFIGSACARALLAAGYRVRGLGRDLAHGRRTLPNLDWVEGDLRRMTAPDDWAEALTRVDVVVNAAGALQAGAGDDLHAVHEAAIAALAIAAHGAGTRLLIQISAVGATPEASTEFLRSKARGDQALRDSALPVVILCPGLVIAQGAYGGTALIRALAAFPCIQPLSFGESPVQTLSMEDLTGAVLAGIEGKIPPGTEADLVAPTPVPFRTVIAAHRRWLGLAPAREIAIPAWTLRLVAAGADALGRLGWRAPLRSTALTVMRDGVCGNAEPWRQLTGAYVADLDAILATLPATPAERRAARLYLLMPLAVAALALLWIASGAIGLWRAHDAAAVLAPAGVPSGLALALVWLGSLADLAVGFAILMRRWARMACLGMVGLSLAYLALGTALTPWLWADPLGPLAKIPPVIALALITHALQERR